MKCDLCGGIYKKELMSYTLLYEGKRIIVENVPAYVCQRCGEKLFEPDIVEKLQNVIWGKKKAQREIKTPFYDLATL